MFVGMMIVAIVPIPVFMLVIFRMIALLALTVSIESFKGETEKGGCRDQIERVELHLLTMKAVGMIKTIQRLQMSVAITPSPEEGGAAKRATKPAKLSRAQKREHKQVRCSFLCVCSVLLLRISILILFTHLSARAVEAADRSSLRARRQGSIGHDRQRGARGDI